MWKYPLTSDKNGYVPLEDALQWCNMSFYDGFIAAFLRKPGRLRSNQHGRQNSPCFCGD